MQLSYFKGLKCGKKNNGKKYFCALFGGIFTILVGNEYKKALVYSSVFYISY